MKLTSTELLVVDVGLARLIVDSHADAAAASDPRAEQTARARIREAIELRHRIADELLARERDPELAVDEHAPAPGQISAELDEPELIHEADGPFGPYRAPGVAYAPVRPIRPQGAPIRRVRQARPLTLVERQELGR